MIQELLKNKTDGEKANIKGLEIAKMSFGARNNVKFSGADYDIEIIGMNPIKGGVEVFAKAWDQNGQIGFGVDGTIDIERFVIINPPILVTDLNGDIIREYLDEHVGETKQRKLREDPILAILQSLTHTISVKKQKFDDRRIVKGKIGNTTLTAYPNASTGTAPIDSILHQTGVAATFATLRAGAGDGNANTIAEVSIWNLRDDTTTNTYTLLRRGGFGFDTSSIATDNVDSAILSFYVTNKGTVGGDTDADIVDFNPGTLPDFANGDYVNFGTTRFATGKTISSGITTSAYNDFTLNASGIANINKSGNSYFGTRLLWDVDNTTPGWSSGAETFVDGFMADTAGTTEDPKLVVEHSASAVFTPVIMVF